MAKLVSKTYGDALFAVACEEDCIDEFFEAAVCVADSLRTNEEFGELMNHPNIGKEEKIKIVEETFLQKIPKEIIGHFLSKKDMRKTCVPCSNILSDL